MISYSSQINLQKIPSIVKTLDNIFCFAIIKKVNPPRAVLSRAGFFIYEK